ncbi:hypothetical protein, partial [Leptospira bourretii]
MKFKNFLLFIVLFTHTCKSIHKIDEYKAEGLIKNATIQIKEHSKPKLNIKLSNDKSYIFI